MQIIIIKVNVIEIKSKAKINKKTKLIIIMIVMKSMKSF